MIYWAHRLTSPLAHWLPLSFSYTVAGVSGWLAFFFWREKRENAIRNMERVLGPGANPRAVRRLAHRSFVNYAKYLVDMVRLDHVRPDDLDRLVRVEGWEHLTEALARGNGLIFVGGHIGNSDLAAAVLASRGFPVHVIAETLEPPRWDNLVQTARAGVGLRVVPLGSSALRLFRLLRAKGILALMIDRPLDDEGIAVNFFGGQTRVPAGAAALALRTNASILGGSLVRLGKGYVGTISPVIPHPATGDERLDLEALNQALFDWLEQVIRQYPDQWFMFRPMWPAESAPAEP